jgi:phage terminase large subunit-like protein
VIPPDFSTACIDWERRIITGEPLVPFLPLFPGEAAAALDVFKALRMVDVVGKPTLGEICRPWILDFVDALFGSYDPDVGRRQIQEALLLVAKKNAKSSTAAGIMLTALIRNWRDSNEFLILAPTVEIANNSFGPARDMVRNDEELDALFQVQDHVRTITHRTNQSTLKVVAADNETVGGKKAAGVLIDEAWLFGKQANAENMLREATGGLASRPEGFVVWLSTQSDDPPAGVFKQKLEYARGVRDGRIVDPRFLPLLYEYPAGMLQAKAHLDRANWRIANPNLGASVSLEYLEREYSKAQNDGEESMRGFLAKHLNVEIGLSLQSNRWTGADFWERAGDPALTLEEIIKRCEVLTVGIDGGGLDDLLGLAVVGREMDTGRWLHWGHAWCHPIVLERRKSEASRLEDFAKAGDLTIVRELGQDIEAVNDVVQQCEASELLENVGVDAVGITDIVEALEAKTNKRTIVHERIIAVPQGWRLQSSVKTVERRLAEGTFAHGARPLMAWAVGNARVELRGNAVTITKQASGTAKIDPLMALFDASFLMALNPASRKKRYRLLTGRVAPGRAPRGAARRR